jgi:hypothetical protein
MSLQELNLLNSYIGVDDLSNKQKETRRELLKKNVVFFHNSYFTLKNSKVKNYQFLNLTAENSDWLTKRYNDHLLPDINWGYRILKNGYIIQGKFDDNYLIGFYFNKDEFKFFLGRNSSFYVIDKYSYPFKATFTKQICDEFKLEYFEPRNILIISNSNVSENFFENINNQLISHLKLYFRNFLKLEKYIQDNQSSNLLNWFDLDGNVFATPQELSKASFFGSDIDNINEFNTKFFTLYQETLDKELLLFIAHKNLPLARSYVIKSDFTDKENILLTDRVIKGFTTAFKKFKNDGNATISTYASYWLLQAYTRGLTIVVRDRCKEIFGVMPTFAKVDEHRKNLKEQLGRHATTDEIVESLKAILEKKVDLRKEEEYEKEVGKFNISGPVKFFESIGLEANFNNKEQINTYSKLILKVSKLILEDREFGIIYKRYFPNKDIDFSLRVTSLETVGEEYNLTRERIRQLEEIAKKKIKVFVHMDNFTDLDENFILLYGQNIIPEDRKSRTGLRKLLTHLNTQDVFFTGQIQDLGNSWLIEKLNEFNINSYTSENYKKYIFGSSKEADSKIDESLLTQSIDILDLSYRAHNCLLENGIYNIKLLSEKSINDLKSIRNLGETSAEEIHYKLNKLFKTKEESTKKLINTDTKIIELKFSIRIQNALNAEKISTLGELLSLSEEDLYNITNLGITSIREILDKISELGLKLKR